MRSLDYSPEDLTFYSKLKAVLRANGILFPLTPPQIEAFETKLRKQGNDTPTDLPALSEILANGKQYNITVEECSPFYPSTEENNFAQAARNGKAIPEEIRRKMQNDRDEKEKKNNNLKN